MLALLGPAMLSNHLASTSSPRFALNNFRAQRNLARDFGVLPMATARQAATQWFSRHGAQTEQIQIGPVPALQIMPRTKDAFGAFASLLLREGMPTKYVYAPHLEAGDSGYLPVEDVIMMSNLEAEFGAPLLPSYHELGHAELWSELRWGNPSFAHGYFFSLETLNRQRHHLHGQLFRSVDELWADARMFGAAARLIQHTEQLSGQLPAHKVRRTKHAIYHGLIESLPYTEETLREIFEPTERLIREFPQASLEILAVSPFQRFPGIVGNALRARRLAEAAREVRWIYIALDDVVAVFPTRLNLDSPPDTVRIKALGDLLSTYRLHQGLNVEFEAFTELAVDMAETWSNLGDNPAYFDMLYAAYAAPFASQGARILRVATENCGFALPTGTHF
jgi:hypothetical protein